MNTDQRRAQRMTKDDLIKLRAKTQVLIEMQRMNLQLLDDHIALMTEALEETEEPRKSRATTLFQLIRETKEHAALSTQFLLPNFTATSILKLDLRLTGPIAETYGGAGRPAGSYDYRVTEARLFWTDHLHTALATAIVLVVLAGRPGDLGWLRIDMKDMKAIDAPLDKLPLHQIEEIVGAINQAMIKDHLR